MINIWIYRPDIKFHPAVNPDYVYDCKGHPYRKVQEEAEAFNNAVREKRINEKLYPSHVKSHQIETRD